MYQVLFNEHEQAGKKHLKDSQAIIEHLNNIRDACSNVDDCNPQKDLKIMNFLDDMIAYMQRTHI